MKVKEVAAPKAPKLDDDFDAHLDLLKHCIEVAEAFGTDQIRAFSFYPSEGEDIMQHHDEVMDKLKKELKVVEDSDMTAENLQELVKRFKALIKSRTKSSFPQDPNEQLWGAISAVFNSWSRSSTSSNDLNLFRDPSPENPSDTKPPFAPTQ